MLLYDNTKSLLHVSVQGAAQNVISAGSQARDHIQPSLSLIEKQRILSTLLAQHVEIPLLLQNTQPHSKLSLSEYHMAHDYLLRLVHLPTYTPIAFLLLTLLSEVPPSPRQFLA